MLETSASLTLHGENLTFIYLFTIPECSLFVFYNAQTGFPKVRRWKKCFDCVTRCFTALRNRKRKKGTLFKCLVVLALEH